jgi:hypothetical protein
MQEQYAEEFRRQAEALSSLARLTEPHADTERSRCMVAVARGLAEVCRMLAEACETDEEEAEAGE